MNLINYIIWSPDPELFVLPLSKIGLADRPIVWYGLLFALGFIISQQILYRIFKADGEPEKDATVEMPEDEKTAEMVSEEEVEEDHTVEMPENEPTAEFIPDEDEEYNPDHTAEMKLDDEEESGGTDEI